MNLKDRRILSQAQFFNSLTWNSSRGGSCFLFLGTDLSVGVEAYLFDFGKKLLMYLVTQSHGRIAACKAKQSCGQGKIAVPTGLWYISSMGEHAWDVKNLVYEACCLLLTVIWVVVFEWGDLRSRRFLVYIGLCKHQVNKCSLKAWNLNVCKDWCVCVNRLPYVSCSFSLDLVKTGLEL